MRKLTFIVTVIVTLACVTWVANAHAQWPQTTQQDSRFSVEFGAKAYDRPGDGLNNPVVRDGITNSILFNSTEASDLGNSPGAEVKFNFMSKNGRELEVRSIIAEWDQSASFTGDDLKTIFFPVFGTEPTTLNYGHDADYFSIELMSRKAVVPGFTCMCGPRFVSAKDRVTVSGTRLVNPGDSTPSVNVTQNQIYEATNAMIGFQGGLELNFPVTRDIYFNSFVRAGGYMNPAEFSVSTFSSRNTIPATTELSETTESFLGEVGGRLYVDIVPNCLSTFIGYEATWMDGVALSTPQFLNTGQTGIDTSNTDFFNALTFGVRLTR